MEKSELNIVRQRRGKGFSYCYESGRQLQDKRKLNRIRKMVIPPNWRDVHIAGDASAPLQATGIDAKGRKQYIYHDNWHKQRQQEKFSKLSDFADALPEFRQFCWRAVDTKGWSREKSLALVCLMLDHTGLRAGNKVYSQQNSTFGLTTLRRQHLEKEGKAVSLSFTGKHGKERHVDISDPKLASLVCDSAQAQGYAIFRYTGDDGRWQDVDSGDVNAFIHSRLGDDFSCKDFRTWGASRFGLLSLPDVENLYLQNQRRRWDTTFVKHIASMLGNTPSVCRQYYIHPKLISLCEEEENRQQTLMEIEGILEKNKPGNKLTSAIEQRLAQIIVS